MAPKGKVATRSSGNEVVRTTVVEEIVRGDDDRGAPRDAGANGAKPAGDGGSRRRGSSSDPPLTDRAQRRWAIIGPGSSSDDVGKPRRRPSSGPRSLNPSSPSCPGNDTCGSRHGGRARGHLDDGGRPLHCRVDARPVKSFAGRASTTQISTPKLSTTHMAGAHHSCPAPSDSTGSSSLPEKGQDDRLTGLYRVSTLDQVVSTLETLPENLLANLGQCVDTRSSSVDTRGPPRKKYKGQ
ncbi:hypothetical protein Taro_044487, partial [Colocasia esculenta]|nr:hypothetical protein [Colocasia esculenta]